MQSNILFHDLKYYEFNQSQELNHEKVVICFNNMTGYFEVKSIYKHLGFPKYSQNKKRTIYKADIFVFLG